MRDESAHGTRRLFLDDVFVTDLLAFLYPTIQSLRSIEDFSQTLQAQKQVALRKLYRSTLYDINQLANPGRLAPILNALPAQLLPRADIAVASVVAARVAATLVNFVPICALRDHVQVIPVSARGPGKGRQGVPHASNTAVCNLQIVSCSPERNE